MSNLRPWVQAARLRTLPLALSSIILGTLLATHFGRFDALTLVLCILTATSYQVLSNYANDLGDGLRGTDAKRTGEARAIASGSITIGAMKNAVVVFFILSLALGTWLSIHATQGLASWVTWTFVILGLIACLSAIGYTMGRTAYGYRGLGDVFVLLFFGWTGVMGTFFLQAQYLEPLVWLPATAIGLVAVGVLNLNNMRDIENDRQSRKITLAVRMGIKGARIYHTTLLMTALVLSLIFIYESRTYWALIFLLVLPVWIRNLKKVWKEKDHSLYDPLLKPLAISAFLYAILFGVGVNLGTLIMLIQSNA
ncbi:MAG: 1,4-dihydroxy-2-naphthoate octaprenyltransferase [Bacteroidota bacterium]|nr:1,4-dihydroxy-2-naphthoate octaprenyltransferase [Bacteroidota bacterium]